MYLFWNYGLEGALSTIIELMKNKKIEDLSNIYRKIRLGDLVLEDPSPPIDFASYLSRLDYSLWLWTALVLTFLTLATVFTSGFADWIRVLRMLFGSLMVLFLPGYATIQALYSRERELSDLEELALSIGLSLALVPLFGLVLNYTPWGIRLDPVLGVLTGYTVVVLFVAAYRKYLLVQRSVAKRSGVGVG